MSRKKAIFILLSIFFLLGLATTGYSSEKPTCAVLLFHPDLSASNNLQSQTISANYAELINRLEMFEVIDFKKASDILKDKNASDLGKTCTDLGCALKLGNKLNADFVIYGIIGSVGSLFSLDTTLVNVAGGNETQHAVYDFEGTQQEFVKNASAENIKSLFGLHEIPAAKELPVPVPVAATTPQTIEAPVVTQEETPPKKTKNLFFGPRIGIGASNDGIEVGGGFEVQFSQLSLQFLINDSGYVGGFSFYLHKEGNSPFAAIAFTSYDDVENHGVDEEGDIYGLLLGYRITLDNYVEKDFAKHINVRIGAGVGYADWRQTEPNKSGEKDSDEEIIPVCELTLGYMF